MAFTMATTISVTSLISLKLWKQCKEMEGSIPTRSVKFYHFVLMLMIESGVLYTVSWAAFLIVFLAGSPGDILFMLQIMPQIIGIAPTLILFQLQYGRKSISIHTHSNTISSPQWARRTTRIGTQTDSCFTVTKPQVFDVDTERISHDDNHGLPLVRLDSSPRGPNKVIGSEECV
ncbi:hypothetical protein FRC02_003420 [Tulasnella sp. 418]|nr:hypothetical protein FRC02_003420 [Tulasnella sp. 418]